jgi:hypothetical protein
MGRILIQVRLRHIYNGSRTNCIACPISLAVKEAMAMNAYTTGSMIECGAIKFKLPRSAYRFIQKYDRNGAAFVKPFNFYLVPLGS